MDSLDSANVYHATMASPLGDMMLCATSTHLVGLYFTDQKDCPPIPGKQAARADSLDPTSGVANGLALRKFSVRKKEVGPAYLPGLEPALDHGGLRGGHDAAIGGVWQGGGMAPPLCVQENTPVGAQAIFAQVQSELADYFLGQPVLFKTPLVLIGTAFQTSVWRALLAIPHGAVVSYADVALGAGLTSGHGRAVGTAVGRNPISIIVPCHRVLSTSHTLAGYTGGLPRKAALLQLEGYVVRSQF